MIGEIGDGVHAPGHEARQDRRTAIGDAGCVPLDVWIGEDRRKRDREYAQHISSFVRK